MAETKFQNVERHSLTTRQEFLDESSSDVVLFETPSLKTPGKVLKFRIRPWTADQRDKIIEATKKPNGGTDATLWLAMTLQAGMVDPAFGSREDLALLKGQVPALLETVAKEIWRLSGISIDAKEVVAAKNG